MVEFPSFLGVSLMVWFLISALIVMIFGPIVAIAIKNYFLRRNDKDKLASSTNTSELDSKVKEKRKWEIPQHHIEEVLALWDKYEQEGNLLERYSFWKRIEELFPETKDLYVEFEPDEKVMHPYIRECSD